MTKRILLCIALLGSVLHGQYAPSASGSSTAAAEINSKLSWQTSTAACAGLNGTIGKDFCTDTVTGYTYKVTVSGTPATWAQFGATGATGAAGATGAPGATGAAGAAGPTGGGVTSVTTSCGISGGPITTTGTIAFGPGIAAHNGNYTILTGDCGNKLTSNTVATWSLAQSGASGFPAKWWGVFENTSANSTLTITTTGSTFYGDGASGSSVTVPPGTGLQITGDGTNWLVEGPGGSGVGTTAFSLDLGPLGSANGYVGYYPAWSLAQDTCGGNNVTGSGAGTIFSFHFPSGFGSCVGRFFVFPSDYSSSQPVTVTLWFGPETAAATGNIAFLSQLACTNTTQAGTWNATATTGAVAVTATQYAIQTGTTGALTVTGCTPGSLARIAFGLDGSNSTTSATYDVIGVAFNYTRK